MNRTEELARCSKTAQTRACKSPPAFSGGAEIATAIDAPLDLALVRKIGLPFQPELAIAAVVNGDQVTDFFRRDAESVATGRENLRSQTGRLCRMK